VSAAAALAVLVLAVALAVAGCSSPPPPPSPERVLAVDGYRLVQTYGRAGFSDADTADLAPYLADGSDIAALGQRDDGSQEAVFLLRSARAAAELRALLPTIERQLGPGASSRISGRWLIVDTSYPAS
jgi:hypothetical protein